MREGRSEGRRERVGEVEVEREVTKSRYDDVMAPPLHKRPIVFALSMDLLRTVETVPVSNIAKY